MKLDDMRPLVEVKNITKEFPVGKGRKGSKVLAVNNVSFNIMRREVFGLAGIAGSGKSTIGLIILNLMKPTTGEVIFDNQVISNLNQREMLPFRSQMQMVFQNPLASLNPRKTAASNLELPLINLTTYSPKERKQRILEMLHEVGLEQRHAQYYPHEFSGGQCQRLGIARALICNPKFIFLDEPVSALDVSIQAQILNLLKELQEKLGVAFLFVANNLNIVQFISDRLAILEAGRIIEMGDTVKLFSSPKQKLTKKLISSIISLDKRAQAEIE